MASFQVDLQLMNAKNALLEIQQSGLPLKRKILIVYITSILLIEAKAEEILGHGSGPMARTFA